MLLSERYVVMVTHAVKRENHPIEKELYLLDCYLSLPEILLPVSCLYKFVLDLTRDKITDQRIMEWLQLWVEKSSYDEALL